MGAAAPKPLATHAPLLKTGKSLTHPAIEAATYGSDHFQAPVVFHRGFSLYVKLVRTAQENC
ncbi:MAG TPA: hypothetical protein PKI32_07635, partial [Opitutales bacterium]|nr:hypothetical protein [Opitutales bacterium]